MSGVKGALKAAKSALDGQKYEEAIQQANIALKSDPKHYHAYGNSIILRKENSQLT